MDDKYFLALHNLKCTEYSTLEEIKYQFRKLSKIYHPDINTSGLEDFRNIKESFDYINKNYISKKEIKRLDSYYRFLDKPPYVVTLPFKKVKEDCIIYCMLHMTEIKIPLSKGKELPLTIKLTNLYDIIIHINTDKFIEDDNG